MNESSLELRDKILTTLLPEIVFDGWAWEGVEKAGKKAGYDKLVVKAIFPNGIEDVIAHLSDWADREMIAKLERIDIEPLRIRDRVKTGVMTRLNILLPYKEAVKDAMTYWMMPTRGLKAGKAIWKTADKIWVWAGDTATDYNHYTKRGLLSGVITTTTLAWMNNDDDPSLKDTEKFLERRIENVLKIGQFVGRLKKAS